jgi:hypothetical protein
MDGDPSVRHYFHSLTAVAGPDRSGGRSDSKDTGKSHHALFGAESWGIGPFHRLHNSSLLCCFARTEHHEPDKSRAQFQGFSALAFSAAC